MRVDANASSCLVIVFPVVVEQSWLQAAVAITGRYLLRLLPMGEVPFTTADDRREAAATGVCQPQRLTGPPVRAH